MIPSHIKIGAIIYEVVLLNQIDDGDTHGQIDWNKDQIQIDSNLPQGQRERTLLHEIIHAINTQLGETEVDYLAGAIHQVLKENNLNLNE